MVRWAKKLNDAALLIRTQIVQWALCKGLQAREVAQVLNCAPSCVYRWINRFVQGDRDALLDRRHSNGTRKATEDFQAKVAEILHGTPIMHGYSRPTWTRELLVRVLEAETNTRISVCVMGRVLHRLGARRGNPKPIVLCPLSNRQQRRRLARIRKLIDECPADQVVVFEDEADIHLNPKIGLDWMHRGYQRVVVTPGKNQKAYVAGALDARDGTIVWTGALKKDSSLFVQMLEKLTHHYAAAKRIHVIVDNYGIHSSSETRRALRQLGRIQLHFLPPYSPDHNRIERLWQDLHANVTRNHQHKTLESLCDAVSAYLNAASPWKPLPRPKRRRVRLTPSRRTLTNYNRPKNQPIQRSALPQSRSAI